jgi:hypothetical protein
LEQNDSSARVVVNFSGKALPLQRIPAPQPARRRFVSAEEHYSERASRIVIPRLEFNEESLPDMIEKIRREAMQRDAGHVGVVIDVDPYVGSDAMKDDFRARGANDKIALSLSEIPFPEALRYAAGYANCFLVTRSDGFAIVPPPKGEPFLNTRTIPLDGAPKTALSQLRANARQYFEARGVAFGENASCTVSSDGKTLVARNTMTQLRLLQDVLEALPEPRTRKSTK